MIALELQYASGLTSLCNRFIAAQTESSAINEGNVNGSKAYFSSINRDILLKSNVWSTVSESIRNMQFFAQSHVGHTKCFK